MFKCAVLHVLRNMQEGYNLQGKGGFICDICMDSVAVESMHAIAGCFHEYCKGCLEQHILVHMESKNLPVPCPGMECGNSIAVHDCTLLLCNQTDVHRLVQAS